jgi:hypothetical protein
VVHLIGRWIKLEFLSETQYPVQKKEPSSTESTQPVQYVLYSGVRRVDRPYSNSQSAVSTARLANKMAFIALLTGCLTVGLIDRQTVCVNERLCTEIEAAVGPRIGG